MYLNKQLEDEKTLDYYDIQSNSTIHLILRLHGGFNQSILTKIYYIKREKTKNN